MRPYQKYPRPEVPYYETRFPYLSQGDIWEDVPFGTLGPELRYIGSPLEVFHVAIGLLLRQAAARLPQLSFAAAQQLQYKVILATTSRFVDRSIFEPPMN